MRRAQAVVTELTTAYRVSPDRLQASWQGFSAPIAPNDTEAGRAKDRWAEFVRKKKDSGTGELQFDELNFRQRST